LRTALAVNVDAVEIRGVAFQRLFTETLYLVAWPGVGGGAVN
jgi:LysR family nitrogen assimilation transcriptional regulator